MIVQSVSNLIGSGRRTGVLVFAASFGLAAMFAAIAGGTYDYDEFVYLLLGHALAAGQLPYRDFLFFNPPGILGVVAALEPLASHWWIWARIVSMMALAGTCTLTYLIARRLTSEAVALAAALICAANPIMLTTGTRVMPDIYIALCVAFAVYCVLRSDAWRWAVPAGVAFGLAIAFKYPAVLLLPACVLLARRRSPLFLAATVATVVMVLVPFVGALHQLYADTVSFQAGRNGELASLRFGSVILFAVVLQPLAVFGCFVRPRHAWLILAYGSVLAFVFVSQVYYHYVTPMVPYGSILGAIYLGSLHGVTARRIIPLTAAGALGVTLLWSAIVSNGGSDPLHMTAAPLSSEQALAAFVDQHVQPGGIVLSDSVEAAYMAHRRNLHGYFWNDAAVMPAQELQAGTFHLRYVISAFGPSTGYPAGFADWVDARFCRTLVPAGFVYDLTCRTRGYLPPRG